MDIPDYTYMICAMSEIIREYFLSISPLVFYIFLWVLIYIETALVIAFFLPGDTVLFTAGLVVAVTDQLNIWLTCLVIATAAIVGDNTAYVLGKKYGEGYITKKQNNQISKIFVRSQGFYEKYGISTIYLARFYPWFRTLVPFSAGIAKMPYPKFWLANIFGGISWAFGITLLGYLANSISVLKDSSRYVAIFFILLTCALTLKNYLKAKRS